MPRIQIESSETPRIRIDEVAGSLQLKAWDEPGIRIEVEDEEHLDYSFKNDELKLSTESDCYLRVPAGSQVHIEEVSGNADILGIEAALTIVEVNGNLNVKNVGAITISEVAGNLTARNIEGDLRVDEVSGNASFRDIEGNLSAKQVSANLNLRGVEGNVNVVASGNAEMQLELQDDANYSVEAGGNIFCHVDPPGDARVKLSSGNKRMHIYTENEKQTRQIGDYEFTLGRPAAELTLNAGGHIDFRCREGKDFGPDFDFVEDLAGLADEITEQVSAQMGTQLEALNDQLTALGDRLRNSGSRAAAQAQRRVEHAQRRLERKLRDRKGRIITVAPGVRNAEPVSTQERALILQMVQEKKISVQEAEMLLNTLDGRAPAQPVANEPKEAAAEPEGEQPKDEGNNA